MIHNSSISIHQKKHLWQDFITIIIVSTLLSFNGLYSRIFFRDFSILFEGAYRINCGQIPYRDFFLPVGPVSMYMQSFFNAIFGVNLIALASHISFLTSILAIGFYITSRKDLGRPVALFAACACWFSFNGINTFPWYNQTGFFFFGVQLLLMVHFRHQAIPTKVLGLCSILSALSIYSKQDIGLLQFILSSLYFFLFSSNKSKTIVFYILPSFLLTVIVYTIFNSISDFQYWFNLGQSPHSSRLRYILPPSAIHIYCIRFSLVGLLLFGLLAQFQVFQNTLGKVFPKVDAQAQSEMALLTISVAVPYIISLTSGLPAQSTLESCIVSYYLIFCLLKRIFYKGIVKQILPFLKILFCVALCVSLMPMRNSIRQFLCNISTIERWYDHDFATKLRRRYSLEDYVRNPSGSYKGALMHKTGLEDITALKELIRSHSYSFFNISELSFLYADAKIAPPTGVPLWYDYKTSFFNPEIKLIRENLVVQEYQLIVFQSVFDTELDGGNSDLDEKLVDYYNSNGYTLKMNINPPSDGLPLKVFKKNSI